jgi:hypothetical protein
MDTQTVVISAVGNPILSPTLYVTPVAQYAATQQYNVSATPGYGVSFTISLRALIHGTTGINNYDSSTIYDGTYNTLTSGYNVTVNRPPFGSTPAMISFEADNNSGAGHVQVQRTIPCQDINTGSISGSITNIATNIVGLATASLSSSQAAALTVISASLIGAVTGSGGGGSTHPSINVFNITSVNQSGNYITIAWSSTNEPSGVHYNLVGELGSTWGPVTVSYSSISSPYTFYCSDFNATLGKAGGWETVTLNLDLQMHDASDITVSDRSRSTSQPATYAP